MEELGESKHKNQRKKIYVQESSASIEDLLNSSSEDGSQKEKSEFLKIKPISFETKTHKTLKTAREKSSKAALKAGQKINNSRAIILLSIALLAGLAFIWFLNKSKTTSSAALFNEQSSANDTNLRQELITQASLDASDSINDTESPISTDKDILDTKENISNLSQTKYKEGWSATYQSLKSLYTTEERALVMLPAWLIGASKTDRCFGENCLPQNVLKVDKRFCIETKFSNKPADTEIAEVVGYFGNSIDKNVKTLSFDQYTATRHKIKTIGVQQGVSWRLVKCPF